MSDSYIVNLNTSVDWETVLQEQAFEEREKYKEGKFIVEKAKVMKVCSYFLKPIFENITAGTFVGIWEGFTI